MEGRRVAPNDPPPEDATLLGSGTVTSVRLVPYGSNYTFLACIQAEDGRETSAIYKPCAGEIPLRDFPNGTLYKRERAAYLLSQLLGWGFIPLTVIRDGPHGVGSMQLYVEHNPNVHYFTLRDHYDEELRRFCLFDWLANNADRKAGHVLLGAEGGVWGIDHGLTFHELRKLRTVIWDFAGEPVSKVLLDDLRRLPTLLDSGDPRAAELRELLDSREMDALAQRLEGILEDPEFPDPSMGRIPWPWM